MLFCYYLFRFIVSTSLMFPNRAIVVRHSLSHLHIFPYAPAVVRRPSNSFAIQDANAADRHVFKEFTGVCPLRNLVGDYSGVRGRVRGPRILYFFFPKQNLVQSGISFVNHLYSVAGFTERERHMENYGRSKRT